MSSDAFDRRLRAWPLDEPAVCGVGSLPFVTTPTARAFVRNFCPVAPFLPELPHSRGGRSMIAAARVARSPNRIESALRAIRTRSTRLFKLQTCGPLTLAKVVGGSTRAAERSVATRVDEFLRAKSDTTPRLIVIDEPAARDVGDPAALVSVLKRVRAGGAFAGIHCCDTIDPAFVERIDPDLLSFDAWNGLEALARSTKFRRWYARGRALAIGIVPTTPAEFDTVKQSLRIAEALTALGFVAGRSPAPLLTGNCGFALSTEPWTRRAHRLLEDLAALLKEDLARCSSTARTSR